MTSASVYTAVLTKTFGNFTAVDRVNLEVTAGEIFGFLGANGAGKTTTIRMLCGLLKPTSGEGKVAGIDILRDNEKIKDKIGYMSQKFSLYPDLTVMENLLFFGRLYQMQTAAIQKRIEALDAIIRIRDIAGQLTSDLPLGIKQRVALVSAIIHNPEILFLDEPTSGVDPVSRREFWQTIRLLASEGYTIFVTTHFMDEAEYCHRISIMHKGKIVALDTPENLKKAANAPTIQSLFIDIIRETDRESPA
jgi:ABC-2 type transport system ATP-binding protein